MLAKPRPENKQCVINSPSIQISFAVDGNTMAIMMGTTGSLETRQSYPMLRDPSPRNAETMAIKSAISENGSPSVVDQYANRKLHDTTTMTA